MTFTLRLTPCMRQQLYYRLHQASANCALPVVQRLHAPIALAEGMTVHDVARMLGFGELNHTGFPAPLPLAGNG